MKVIATTMVLGIISSIMVSCSGYDDDYLLNPNPTTENTNNNDDNNDNNDNNNNNDSWESVLDDWYNILNNTLIDSHKETNLKEYNVQAPFGATLGEGMYFVTMDSKMSEYRSMESINANVTYGEWYANEENDSIREVASSQNVTFSLYNRVLRIKNAQAYRIINGQRESFEMPVVVTSFAGHSSDVKEIERNDSIFNRETVKDSVRIAFSNRPDIAPFHVSAKTVIDHFVKVKENNQENNMPNPDVKVNEDIVSISDRTATPVFGNNTITWYEASLVKTTDKVYVIINGQLKETWNNSDLASVDWCNSAMFDTVIGKWIPCHLAMDANNKGWSYTFQLADSTNRTLSAPMNASLISSLKSFVKDNSASQTPFLTQGSVKRTFADGDFYTVNGLYTYTVAHK